MKKAGLEGTYFRSCLWNMRSTQLVDSPHHGVGLLHSRLVGHQNVTKRLGSVLRMIPGEKCVPYREWRGARTNERNSNKNSLGKKIVSRNEKC